MKICPTCRSRYGDEKNFCRNDGARLLPDRAHSPEVVARRELLEQRLEEEPEDPTLLLELGDLYATIPLYDEALVQYFKALDTGSRPEVARRRIADVHRARGEWAEAIRHLELLAEAAPAEVPLLGELAEAYGNGGRRAEAAAVFARMCDLAPSEVEAWRRRRELLGELRRTDELLRVLRRLTELCPEELSCWVEFAEALVAAGVTRAEEWTSVEGALASAGGALSPPAVVYLCWARLRTGSAGSELLERLRAVDPAALDRRVAALGAQALFEAAALCRTLGGEVATEAAEAYELALRFHDHPGAREALGTIHARRADALAARGRYLDAARAAEAGLAFCRDDPVLLRKRRSALGKRRLRRALWTGAVLLLAALLGLAARYHREQGFFGEAPTREDLTRSFGKYLKAQPAVASFSARAGGRELSFELGGSRWRVIVRGAAVRPTEDETRSYRGTLETRWEKDGRAVWSLKSMPPELTRLGLGPGLNAARYNGYSRRWTW